MQIRYYDKDGINCQMWSESQLNVGVYICLVCMWVRERERQFRKNFDVPQVKKKKKNLIWACKAWQHPRSRICERSSCTRIHSGLALKSHRNPFINQRRRQAATHSLIYMTLRVSGNKVSQITMHTVYRGVLWTCGCCCCWWCCWKRCVLMMVLLPLGSGFKAPWWSIWTSKAWGAEAPSQPMLF